MASTVSLEHKLSEKQRLKIERKWHTRSMLRKGKAAYMTMTLAFLLGTGGKATYAQQQGTDTKTTSSQQSDEIKPISAADSFRLKRPHLGRMTTYNVSKITLATGILLDYGSSVAFSRTNFIKEADPIFQNRKGRFDVPRATAIGAVGIVGGWMLEDYLVRRHPKLEPWFVGLNFGLGSIEYSNGIRNSRLMATH